MKVRTLCGVASAWLCATVVLNADTLVLKDGRQIEGRLITAEGGVIDFEARSDAISDRRERLRIARERVRYIDFEEIVADPEHALKPGLVLVSAAQGRDSVQQQPAQQAQAAPSARGFGSDVGMVLNFIKADKTGDFEMVMGKLKEALMKSPKPERQKQAAGWKVFKATDGAAAGSALYVYFVDPTVKGADYAVTRILAEGLPPSEIQAVFKAYGDTFAQGQNVVSLTLVSDLGK